LIAGQLKARVNGVMTKQILFVDDEAMVLRGIERSLRGMRQEWQLEFAEGGRQALEMMSRSHFDVVITDMRMPGMDGAQLLREVKSRFPEMVRMVLSGQSDEATVYRAIRTTHQYLSKPCDAEEIKRKLAQALALRDLLDDPGMKQVVSRLESVPSQPSCYAAVQRTLESPGAAIADAGALIAADMGMVARVLQLVNSAFLGPATTTSNARRAVSQLGWNHLTTLVMAADIFSAFDPGTDSAMEHVWSESLATAALAKEIARAEGGQEGMLDDAYTAGLLHDIGKLVLAAEYREEYEQVLRQAQSGAVSLEESEQERFGCTHAQVGGYLLGLWGLPNRLVEAVAWHHQPAKAKPSGFGPLLAVHAADALLEEQEGARRGHAVDGELLDSLGLGGRLPSWTGIARGARRSDAP
jgi:putative nucleotidyltransferase with HDIG domain